MTRYNMAVVLFRQGRYSKALQIYQEVFEIQRRPDVLGTEHPDTLLTNRDIAIVLKKQKSRCLIRLYQKRQKVLLKIISTHFPNLEVKSVEQGLYLPSLGKCGVGIGGMCATITRGLSQALFLQGGKSFLNNLETLAEIYERIAQSKQVSKREEETFAFGRLLDDFEQQLDLIANSLPSNLIYTKGYKTLSDLSDYMAGIKGDFAIHLVTSNYVVAVYRTGDHHAYFDSNMAFVSGLKSVDQLVQVVKKAIESAGYKVEKRGFFVEHFNVDKANKLLSDEDKQILTKEIKTERQLLAEQDKEFYFIKNNRQEASNKCLFTTSNDNQQRNQLSKITDKMGKNPKTCLNDITIDNQLKKTLSC